MSSDSLTIAHKRYEIPIHYGTHPRSGAAIAASDPRQIKTSDGDFGRVAHDPSFTDTASRGPLDWPAGCLGPPALSLGLLVR
jgi:hypothetical protein